MATKRKVCLGLRVIHGCSLALPSSNLNCGVFVCGRPSQASHPGDKCGWSSGERWTAGDFKLAVDVTVAGTWRGLRVVVDRFCGQHFAIASADEVSHLPFIVVPSHLLTKEAWSQIDVWPSQS